MQYLYNALLRQKEVHTSTLKALLVSGKCVEVEADLNTSSTLSSCD